MGKGEHLSLKGYSQNSHVEQLSLDIPFSPWRNFLALCPGTFLLDCVLYFDMHKFVFDCN